MRKVKWGILGSGKIAEKFASDLQFVENAELIAAVSKTKEKVKLFADKFNVPKVYTTYEDFVKDPEIEAVYVATTHNFHFENTKLCLEHKKAVLCEKPITVNQSQLLELQAIARANKVLLMEALWTYFLPTIKMAQTWIREGKIGEVNTIYADFGYKAEYNETGRLYNPSLAGGALLDIGIYPILFAELLTKGKAVNIKSVLQMSKTNVDQQNGMLITYDSGELAILSSSILSNLKNEGIIHGSKGHIKIHEFWKSTIAELETETETVIFEDKRQTYGYNYEAQHFSNLLLDGKLESEVASFEVSNSIMQIMDKVREQNNFVYPFE